MSYIASNIRHIRPLFLFLFFVLSFTSCSSDSKEREVPPDMPLRDSSMFILSPEAPAVDVQANDIFSMDISNLSQGYLVVTYSGTNDKVKFQITSPNGVKNTHLITEYGVPVVFPITEGNGNYTFTLLESVDVSQDLYAIAFSHSANVTLEDELLPFLTPNLYVNYNETSNCVEKGVELAQNCYWDLDVVENIFLYVTKNITYDTPKAQSVSYGYIPNPDKILEAKTGICFDYASLMTAMLRSQHIPTRLEVGYVGDVYHAWISCYVEETGWVDKLIYFDGKSWSLMDPTLSANNDKSAAQEYIGDGSNYIVKYTY